MTKRAISFVVEGNKLKGNLYTPKSDPKSLKVLFLHGWSGKANDDAAKFLCRKGFSAMTMSLSGHNGSDGSIEDQNRQKSLKEVIAAYDFFKLQLPNKSKVVVAGNSYGAYLATILTSKRQVHCVQLRVPANYDDDSFDKPQIGQGGDNKNVMKWREKALTSEATMALRALHKFEGAVQILEAENDERVPCQTVKNYINAIKDKSKLEYHFMNNWPHSLGNDKNRNQLYRDILLNWLNKQL